ncbi:MAG: bifunctional precorrin-2 dehydrogenase/sirohydrochlorin ferrochelatase [Candidatus Omnitrophota bacterium]
MGKYYPINLNLENKDCLVIGAGVVAERKIKRLLEYGVNLTVVSPNFSRGISMLAKKNRIRLIQRRVNLKDIRGKFLVISASGERRINSLVSKYCKESNILVNVVDSPIESNFILPSIVKRGNLTISISTEGISPALAKKIRQDLEEKFGTEYEKLLKIMKKIRPEALKKIKDGKKRKAFFEKVVKQKVLNLLKQGKQKEAKRSIERLLENVA